MQANDFAYFLAYAKANPGKISYGTIGTGSAQDIFARQIEDLAGIDMTAVPYRGGALVLPDMLRRPRAVLCRRRRRTCCPTTRTRS